MIVSLFLSRRQTNPHPHPHKYTWQTGEEATYIKGKGFRYKSQQRKRNSQMGRYTHKGTADVLVFNHRLTALCLLPLLAAFACCFCLITACATLCLSLAFIPCVCTARVSVRGFFFLSSCLPFFLFLLFLLCPFFFVFCCSLLNLDARVPQGAVVDEKDIRKWQGTLFIRFCLVRIASSHSAALSNRLLVHKNENVGQPCSP